MKTADGAIARLPLPADSEVAIDSLYRPFLRRWRLVATLVALSCAAALALIFVPRREYRSQLVLAAVPNARTASIAGGISSLLGNAQMGGVQSTPYFITRLLMLRGVLREVAESPVGANGGRGTVIERVLGRPASQIRPAEIEPAMRNLVSTEVDKQTGLVTLSVTHADSALTRHVAEQLVAAAGRTFVKVLRSQACEQRESGEAKVDSARRQLQRAEARLQEFQSTHRVYASYSNAAVERQRIDRELASAQTAYSAAVEDRQSAIARELEESPAVVVVDPIPADLSPQPRQAVLKLVLAIALGVVAATVVLVLSGEFARTALEDERRAARASAAAA